MKINYRRSSQEYQDFRKYQLSGMAYHDYKLRQRMLVLMKEMRYEERGKTGINPDGSRYMPYTKRRPRN